MRRLSVNIVVLVRNASISQRKQAAYSATSPYICWQWLSRLHVMLLGGLSTLLLLFPRLEVLYVDRVVKH